MSVISDVYEIVKKLPKTLSKLPKTIVTTMQKSAGPVVAVAAPIGRNLPLIAQPFEHAGELIRYIGTESAAVRGQSGKLRTQMTTFSGGLKNCIAQLNELSAAVDKRLPHINGQSAFAVDLLNNVLSRIPDIALLPIAKALAERPGWETQPDQAAELIKLIIPKVASKDPQEQKDVDLWFLEVLTIFKMVNIVLALIIRLLPRDLAAGLAVVGEGGTLTVTGHPLAWIFVVTSALIDEAHTALSAMQQWIKLKFR